MEAERGMNKLINVSRKERVRSAKPVKDYYGIFKSLRSYQISLRPLREIISELISKKYIESSKP